ncbi:MAG: aspartate aminotransferase family protein [Candidatus Bathyarchaeia archaeon]
MGQCWDRLLELDKRYYLFNYYAAEEYAPTLITETDGAYIVDDKGNRLLDLTAQLMCVNLGNRHQKIQAAIRESLNKFGYVWEKYPTEERIKATCLLMENILGSDGWAGKLRFVSTGSEAVEMGLMLAKLFMNRPNIFTRLWAYHGWTEAARSCTMIRGIRGLLSSRKGYIKDIPANHTGGYFVAPPPYCYRCPLGRDYPDCKVSGKLGCVTFTEHLIEAVGAETVAGVITEVVMGVGAVVPPPEYTPQMRRLTHNLGLLWIDDEVVCGFGRTGKWFAYQHYLPEVKPDIMILGKGLTSAQLPAAGVVVSKEIAKFFEDYRWWHVSTYGAHPIVMAVVAANIEAMLEDGVVDHAAKIGEYLGEGLRSLQDRHRCVGHVAGVGMFWTVEIVKDRDTKKPFIEEDRGALYTGDTSNYPVSIIASKCLEKGCLIGGFTPNTLRITPPLTLNEEEVDKGLAALDYALAAVDKMCPLNR